ncbi:MAG: exosortase H-associated membrane protein, partial [Usitatibacter sp.]
FLVVVMALFAAELTARATCAGQREVIALGYQLGSLILPTLVPVIVWAAFNRGFIEGLLRAPLPRV